MHLTKAMETLFHENGYLLIEDLLLPHEILLITNELETLMSEDSPRVIRETNGEIRSVYGVHQVNTLFERMCRLQKILAPVKQIMNSDIYIHQTKVNVKRAFKGEWWEWHQDFPYWYLYDGMPLPRILSVMIFLDDVTSYNGPLYVIPGSHKEGMADFEHKEDLAEERNENSYLTSLSANLELTISKETIRKWYKDKGLFEATGRAGSALFFHGNVFHASNCNLSPFDRKVLIITYNSTDNTLKEIAQLRPDFLSNRDFTPISPVEEII